MGGVIEPLVHSRVIECIESAVDVVFAAALKVGDGSTSRATVLFHCTKNIEDEWTGEPVSVFPLR